MGSYHYCKICSIQFLVRPLLEYACQVWSPHAAHDICVLEAVQHHAAKWACGSQWNPSSRSWSKSSDICLDALHCPNLTHRHNYLSVSMLYDIFNKRTSWTFSDYYYYMNTSRTRAHELSIVPLQSSTNCYRYSFFVNTAFLWNNVPICILTMKSVIPFRQALYHLFCT